MSIFNLHSLCLAALPGKVAQNLSYTLSSAPEAVAQKVQQIGKPAVLLPALLGVVLILSACGRPMTDEVLRGGVPARTDLHRTTKLPANSIRMVARKDAGWRVIYHPARAPANAEQGAAAALCTLERKRAQEIIVLPMVAPMDDPGARMIDVVCG